MKIFIVILITGFTVQFFNSFALDLRTEKDNISFKLISSCLISALLFPITMLLEFICSVILKKRGQSSHDIIVDLEDRLKDVNEESQWHNKRAGEYFRVLEDLSWYIYNTPASTAIIDHRELFWLYLQSLKDVPVDIQAIKRFKDIDDYLMKLTTHYFKSFPAPMHTDADDNVSKKLKSDGFFGDYPAIKKYLYDIPGIEGHLKAIKREL